MADFLPNDLHIMKSNVMLVKVDKEYKLLKNPLTNGYWSTNEDGGGMIRLLLDSTLYNPLVCYFSPLLADRHNHLITIFYILFP